MRIITVYEVAVPLCMVGNEFMRVEIVHCIHVTSNLYSTTGVILIYAVCKHLRLIWKHDIS